MNSFHFVSVANMGIPPSEHRPLLGEGREGRVMEKNTQSAERPRPIFSDVDHDKLTKIAESALRRDTFVAEALLYELDRALVVDADELPSNVVRMGSVVDFTVDGQSRRVTLVYPRDANFENGKLSILTPIAAAIIGLREGDTIDWKTRDDKTQIVSITSVDNAPATTMAVA